MQKEQLNEIEVVCFVAPVKRKPWALFMLTTQQPSG